MESQFSNECRRCRRLADFLDQVKRDNPDYYAKPVPPFGVDHPRLLVVGLAPGMHGANRTGRPFTGDYAGLLLYETLHRFGFASRPSSVSTDDGLRLVDCRITNAVKCLPPENKPKQDEIRQCNMHLKREINSLDEGSVVLALGHVAHRALLLTLGLKQKDFPFAHGAVYGLPGGLGLYDSYHCSRYNTQTRRLTAPMFEHVFAAITGQLRRS